MKIAQSLYLYSSLIYILYACGEPVYNYAFEQQLLDCYYHDLGEIGNKEKIALEELERVYIKYGILKNKSGRSYIRFIENMKNPDVLRIIYNKNLIKEIKALENLPDRFTCTDSSYIKNVDFSHSKFKYITAITDTIDAKGDMPPEIISNAILVHFTTKDFENEYYKTLALLALANFIINQDILEHWNRK